jgi:glycosyltransferase involved in cell wall biosynthesis
VRVAIDYTAAVNQTAGIGRFVRGLVSGLANLDRENDYVLVYARPNNSVHAQFPEARNFVRRQLPLSQRALDVIWHRLKLPLPADLLSGAVDVFHSPDFVLPPVRDAVRVLTVHDLAFLLRPECADARLRDYLEQAVPRSVRRADFVLADSENTRNDVVCLLGVEPERVEVVPGGVEPSFCPIADPAVLAELRGRLRIGEAPYILTVGVIEPRKNHRRLFEAYRLLRDRRDLPHRLVVVGRKGWLWEEIIDVAESSPYRDDIHLVGFVADEDMPALYSAAEVFALPSLYEGFGLPPLEAMACGTPVVVSNSSSLPEVVGDTGLLVDPSDADSLAAALELVLLDEPLRADLRSRALARAATFTWPAAAAKLLAVYQRLGGRPALAGGGV